MKFENKINKPKEFQICEYLCSEFYFKKILIFLIFCFKQANNSKLINILLNSKMEDLKKGDLLYEDKYKVDKVLGSGGYGKVYLVVDKKYNKLALNSFIFHIYN
jgi:hypothetical protein